jgi:hypothetical protein
MTEKPSIEQQMRTVLGALEMLSHGTTSQWNASGGGGVPDSKLLADDESKTPDAPHVYWRQRFDEAEKHKRERVVQAAIAELRTWRGYGKQARKDLPSDAQILDSRILEAEGWSCAEVAVRLRCTETRVRKIRLANDRMVMDGAKVTPIADHVEDKERVTELASRGLTERQIGLLTKLPKTTIRRLLKRAA